jgi:hypothetical protein
MVQPLPKDQIMITDKNTNQRLAEHLCVTCGSALQDDGPDAVFCGPNCQADWHIHRNGHPPYNRPDVPVRPPTIDPPIVWNDELYRSQQPAVTALDRICTPAEFLRSDSIIPPGPQRPAPDSRTIIGRPAYGDRYSLAAITAEPYSNAWPTAEIPQAQQAGWQLTFDELPPVRSCSRCNTWTTPANAETVICSTCRWPYELAEGVIMVPVWRRLPGANLFRRESLQFGAVTQAGIWAVVVPRAVISEGQPGLDQHIWGGIWDGAAYHANPWHCQIPDCTDKATHWTILTTQLQHAGHVWQPLDGMPLRLGWCGHHWYGLQRNLYTADDAPMRMGPSHGPFTYS